MSVPMRAKLVISHVEENGDNENITFRAVCKDDYDSTGMDENNTYAMYSPSFYAKLFLANPNLVGRYKEGDTFYVDFTPVE